MKWRIGFHGEREGIGDFWRALAGAGIGFFHKTVDNVGAILEAAKITRSAGVHADLVFRYVDLGWGSDLPDFSGDPIMQAEKHWSAIKARLAHEPDLEKYQDMVILETCNEPGAGSAEQTEWLAQFGMALAWLAGGEGWRIMPFTFNAGEPWSDGSDLTAPYRLPHMRSFVEYAAGNPMVAIGFHGAKLAGGLPPGHPGRDDPRIVPAGEFAPWTIGRWSGLNAICREWGIEPPLIAATEWAWDAFGVPGPGIVMPDVEWLQQLYEQHGNALGAGLWTLHNYHGDPAAELQPYIAPIRDLALGWSYTDPDPPPGGGDLPRRVEHTIHLLPQDTTPAELSALTEHLHPTRSAFTYSHDVAHAIAYHSTADGRVVVWDAGRWSGVDFEALYGPFVQIVYRKLADIIGTPPPPPPPPGDTIDLLPFFKGDGRLYEVQTVAGANTGAQERFQVQAGVGSYFYLTKNSQWEEFYADDEFIWRQRDTSPGPAPVGAERPGAPRFYVQREPGRPGARWVKRHMRVGETFEGPGHEVQFYYKRDCALSATNSGPATNRTTLIRHYPAGTWRGLQAEVVEVGDPAGEVMFFARGYGLVGWKSAWGESYISEEHAPGTRPDNARESVC